MSRGHIFGCRGWETLRIRYATVIGVLVPIAWARVAGANDQKVAVATADRLIDAAGKAKTDGQDARAYALLHEAVRTAPDNSLARWQLGQVKVGRDWLSIEEAQRRADADPRQAKYQERREVLSDTPEDQLALARLCRGNNLDDEAQVHWASVLSVQPNNKEALRGAGMRWYAGELKSPTQIKEERKESTVTKQATRQWRRVWALDAGFSDKNKDASIAAISAIRGG